MLLSLLYHLVRYSLGVLAVLVRSDLSKDVELLVLRHENQVLRHHLHGRPRWDHIDQLWLTTLSRLVNLSGASSSMSLDRSDRTSINSSPEQAPQ